MKKICQEDIECVKAELSAKRKEFEKIKFSSLEEKLEWIRKFFNYYVPELEKKYMTEKEFNEEWVFLPDELRIHFYFYFPEHGLNMANYSQELRYELSKIKRNPYAFEDRIYFSHYD